MTRWLVLGAVCCSFAIGCSHARAPADEPRVTARNGTVLIINGNVEVTLVDSLARRNAVDEEGADINEIPGCLREWHRETESSLGHVEDDPSGLMTGFVFSGQPAWPLEVSWVDRWKGEVNLSAYSFTAAEVTCRGSSRVAGESTGVPRRIRISPSGGGRNRCSLLIVDVSRDSSRGGRSR